MNIYKIKTSKILATFMSSGNKYNTDKNLIEMTTNFTLTNSQILKIFFKVYYKKIQTLHKHIYWYHHMLLKGGSRHPTVCAKGGAIEPSPFPFSGSHPSNISPQNVTYFILDLVVGSMVKIASFAVQMQ